jgi:hypothetical protein
MGTGETDITLSYLGTDESAEDVDSDDEARQLIITSPKLTNMGMLKKMLTKGIKNEVSLPPRILD